MNAGQTEAKKCPQDGAENCNGFDKYSASRPLSSAFWAVRQNLGNDAAGALFLAWLKKSKATAIENLIQIEWLVLDDDNGSLADDPPTPHYAAITEAFRSYRWPYLGPEIKNVCAVWPNSELPDGYAWTVYADIQAVVGMLDLSSGNEPALAYALDGGSFTVVPMVPTGYSGQYRATIPGLASPESVRWIITANDTLGHRTIYPERTSYVVTNPDPGPSRTSIYQVGKRIVDHQYSFNSPAGNDQGWTHSGVPEDDWKRLGPGIGVGDLISLDPTTSDGKFWGTDTYDTSPGGGPPTDTNYEPLALTTLRSPDFDLNAPGATGWHLQYQRWISVQDANFDQADILALPGSGPEVLLFRNTYGRDLLDPGWVLHDLDLSALDGQDPVAILFRMTANADGIEYGGWNLDDFKLYHVDPDPGLGNIVQFGFSHPGDGGPGPSLSGSGVPKIDHLGCPSPTESQVSIKITGSVEGAKGLLYAGAQTVCLPLPWGGQRYVDSIVGATEFTVGSGGTVTIPIDMGCVVAGDYYLQAYVWPLGAVPVPVVPPPTDGVTLSNGLWLHVVD